MPDALFAEPRLAAIYDALDPDRRDLDHYVSLAGELGAHSILDIGCGTGTLACRLAGLGHEVMGVDPAGASLAVAKAKPDADSVRWWLGDATDLPPDLRFDLAVMTGNVAQVFVADADLLASFEGIGLALAPGGHLVFEVRDPKRRAWESWNPSASFTRTETTSEGAVETWHEVVDVRDRLVSFRTTFRFEATGEIMTSESTLRFRERDEIESLLARSGFDMIEVRDAPDRPGKEFVFMTRRPG